MILQSILYPVKYGKKKAYEWMKRNGHPIKKVEMTDRYIRFRQEDPLSRDKLKEGWYYITRMADEGVKLVFYTTNYP